MKKLGLIALGVALLLFGYVLGARRGSGGEVTQGIAKPAEAARKIAFYRNPMDPSIHSNHPAKDSMNMDFLPVYEDELDVPESAVAGRAAVVIPADRREPLGVQSEPLQRRPLSWALRTVGRIAPDERLIHHVHTKYDGFIEHVYVDFVGKYVKKGDPLLSIYSPDLFATQQEYLLALKGARELAKNQGDSAIRGQALVEAVRQRLLLWDIRPEEIATLEREGVARRDLDLYSDKTGVVLAKTALHGMRVTPADLLFEIADLSHLWVLADVYEADLPSIRLGMSATVETPSAPGQKLKGLVTFIDPMVEPATRTTKVRVEISNPRGLLKPDMFADVTLNIDLGSALVVPPGAIIDAGARKLAFVDLGDGRYEPREVTLGARAESGWVVLSGLAEGEKVVVAANFLIDSESSLRAAVQSMGAKPAQASSGGH
ncbi:MAG: efflux RND transporter periplasmic adaptor subunit [Vicinamibacteria bacterium]